MLFKKSSFLINDLTEAIIPSTTSFSVNLYVYLTYDSTVNGKTTSNTYILTIPYSDYIVGATGGIEK